MCICFSPYAFVYFSVGALGPRRLRLLCLLQVYFPPIAVWFFYGDVIRIRVRTKYKRAARLRQRTGAPSLCDCLAETASTGSAVARRGYGGCVFSPRFAFAAGFALC